MRPTVKMSGERPQPVRSESRQQLADAISRRGEAREALEAARGASVRGADAVSTAERRLEAATEAVETCRKQRAVEVADGIAPPAANAVRSARAEALDAEDSLDIARTAATEL